MPQNQQTEEDSEINYKRILGEARGETPGPTVVFIAGLHGNEKAGVYAVKELISKLEDQRDQLSGKVLGIAGNLPALARNVRFEKEDLNRLWDPYYIEGLKANGVKNEDEDVQLLELHSLLFEILENENPPLYFIDLHTTSGPTNPFLLLNDSTLNRKFISRYPYPKILGIEEHLQHTMLSYINELGYISFGFESGQHFSEAAVDNALSFLELTLQFTSSLAANDAQIEDSIRKITDDACPLQGFFEIIYHHRIRNGDGFKMFEGFRNFEMVPAGTPLARDVDGLINTEKKRLLFMPLYQAKGTSGFYFIRRVPYFFMKLSHWLRQSRSDRVLVLLPGIKWGSRKKDTLVVNLKTARFMAKPIFHLLGYRINRLGKDHLIIKNRDKVAKEDDYFNAPWF